MSASAELPLSSFAVSPCLVSAEDYAQMLKECDRLQEKINKLKTDFGMPVTLPEVLAELTARNAPCDTKTPASQFVRRSLEMAHAPKPLSVSTP